MPQTTTSRIPRSRLAALILESTSTVVSAVLVAWLLLWFIGRLASSSPVEGFYVQNPEARGSEIATQTSDVRFLRGAIATESLWEAKPADLIEKIKEVIGRSGPAVVLYVSYPTIASEGPGESVETTKSLIAMISQELKRDVVLALDLAQLDSDRDPGVFGNSPYHRLAEFVKPLTPSGHGFVILTSCGPAQKSWSADGLDQSAFAHYLRKGLEGEARDWDRSAELVTTEGLHRYVRAHVAQWAKTHCRAVQTPMLLVAGQGPRKFSIPPVPQSEPPATGATEAISGGGPVASTSSSASAPAAKEGPATAKGEEAAKPKGADASRGDSPPPALSPREILRADLLKEWEEHEALLRPKSRQPAPYRYDPGAWRLLESMLLTAERRVREAWHDEERLGLAREAIENAHARRVELQERIKQRVADDTSLIPFRPVALEAEGRKVLDEVLDYLTSPERRVGPASPAPADGGQTSKPQRPGIPVALTEVGVGGFPRKYLELQLATWAMRFTDDFKVPNYFAADARASQLRQLIEVRRPAEKALCLDRRGNRHLESMIDFGDEIRRKLQDELFAVTDAQRQQPRSFLDQLEGVRKSYETAEKVGQAFMEGRSALENIAARFPDLAEWSIRQRSHAGGGEASLTGDPLPDRVVQVLKRIPPLVDLLDRSAPKTNDLDNALSWVVQLQDAAEAASRALGDLERSFYDNTLTEKAGDWISRDLALRNPLLPLDRRKELLRRVMETPLKAGVRPSEVDGEYRPDEAPVDTGFWSRAVGLAYLDLELQRLRPRGPETAQREEQARQLEESWNYLTRSAATPESSGPLFATFDTLSGAIRRGRLPASARPGQLNSERPIDELEPSLRSEDRMVRFMSTGEIRQRGASAIDQGVEKYDRYGTYVTLRFHLTRLMKDFVGANELELLRTSLNNLAESLGARAEFSSRPISQSLRIRVKPDEKILQVNNDEGMVHFDLGIDASREPTTSGSIPKGLAFVGVEAAPGEQAAGGKDSGPLWDFTLATAKEIIPGRLQGTLVAVPPPIIPEPMPVVVTQKALRNHDRPLTLTSKIFFRGRVDGASETTIAVNPAKYEKIIDVSIAQNKERWKELYGENAVDRITDQFTKHPLEGYMHKGKSLDYVLTVTNVSPRRLTVHCQQYLQKPGVPERQPLGSPEKRDLDPRAKLPIPGRVDSDMVPLGEVRELVLTVLDPAGNELVRPYVVKFRQIDIKKSRYITTKTYNQMDFYRRVRQPCYVVKYFRDADDPVTEPITGPELSCTIEGDTDQGPEGFLLFPGQSVVTTAPRKDGATKWRWSGRVENEELPEQTVNAE